jgi:hypothetical protein
LRQAATPSAAGYTAVGIASCVVSVRLNFRPEITLHRLIRG